MTGKRGFGGTEVEHRDGEPVFRTITVRVEIVDGPERDYAESFRKDVVRFGTAADNDVQLTDPKVSRQHCELRRNGEDLVLKDLGSTNGTFVFDRKVVEAEIVAGTSFRIGRSEIRVGVRKKWERIGRTRPYEFGALVGRAPKTRLLFALLEKVASSDLSCLVHGETGTGKELAARGIHEASPRRAGPLVFVDCASLSSTLSESELFGHERGAFTGAERERAGAFEQANGGTLVLDELGELPLELQPKLLRAIEEREVRRLGAEQPIRVDARLVCLTHRNLEQMVRAETFREDLYYRIAEVVVEVTPLRERKQDIAIIAERIVADEAKRSLRTVSLSPDAIGWLESQRFPGNVRELKNVLRRAVALAEGPSIGIEHLSALDDREDDDKNGSYPLDDELLAMPLGQARTRWNEDLERVYLEKLVGRFEGDVSRAAEAAGLHEKSLRRLLREHGLESQVR
jgi:DNA-binding NtrC family response regulator